jgi:hypothetical protein
MALGVNVAIDVRPQLGTLAEADSLGAGEPQNAAGRVRVRILGSGATW